MDRIHGTAYPQPYVHRTSRCAHLSASWSPTCSLTECVRSLNNRPAPLWLYSEFGAAYKYTDLPTYCYIELAVSPVMAVTTTSTHCTVLRGMAKLSWPGWLVTNMKTTVVHNCCPLCLFSLMKTNALLISQQKLSAWLAIHYQRHQHNCTRYLHPVRSKTEGRITKWAPRTSHCRGSGRRSFIERITSPMKLSRFALIRQRQRVRAPGPMPSATTVTMITIDITAKHSLLDDAVILFCATWSFKHCSTRPLSRTSLPLASAWLLQCSAICNIQVAYVHDWVSSLTSHWLI